MRRGRLTRIAMAAAVASGSVLAFASPALASIDGPCEGQGTFRSTGEPVDARTQNRIVVSEEDDVDYRGAILTGELDRSHDGAIKLDLPFPLPNVAISDWGTDDTDANEDAGTYHYELPWFVPRGIELRLSGYHDDSAGYCSGAITIEVDGGPFDAPGATAVAAVGTILSGAGLAFAGRAKRP